MMQRLSPPVHYPLQSPWLLWRLWRVLALMTALVLLGWLWMGSADAAARLLRAATAVPVWLLSVAAVRRALLRWPTGRLHWSAGQWFVSTEYADAPQLLQAPQVLLDLQWMLLVRFRQLPRGYCYLLLQQAWAPAIWMDLRRAVYSSADLPSEIHRF